jgi:predicted restriction endonuclease
MRRPGGFAERKYIKIASDSLNELIEWGRRYRLARPSHLNQHPMCMRQTGEGRTSRHAGDDTLDEVEAARLVERAARGRRLSETEKKALILSRRGQGQFRDDLLKLWRRRCAITGCRDTRLLRASHLKPWKRSTNPQRLDPFNGLLLAPQLDAALDRGLITFTDSGRIQLSATVSSADYRCLGIRRAMKLSHIDHRHQAYLQFHRRNVFQK